MSARSISYLKFLFLLAQLIVIR